MSTPFLNLSTDNTLGGNSPSDYVAVSEKAIKDYVDNTTGSSVDQEYDPTSQAAQSGVAISGAGFLTSSDLSNYVTLDTLQTLTSGKKIFANDAVMAGNQTALLATISNKSTATSDNAWVGRYICGAKNLTFLMGTYRTMAGIGAHSWTNAQTGSGAGWADFYLNPDGSASVYIGGNLWTKDSGWFKVKNSGNASGTVQVNRGTISSPSWKNVACWNDNISNFVNNSGYITGITSSDVTTALGFTPYDSSNPSGYTSNVGTVTSVNNISPVDGNVTLSIPSEVTETTVSGWGFTKNAGTVTSVNNASPVNGNVTLSIPTDTNDLTNNAGFITSSALSGYATETWVGNQGYITGISSSDVTTALGYTPYNSTNPNGYTTNTGTVTKNSSDCPALTPSNGEITWTITNPYSDVNITVEVIDNTANKIVDVEKTITASTITIKFLSADSITAGDYTALIQG